MDILQSNFDEKFPEIVAAIRESDYVCIDCEFTGLGGGSHSITAYDTPELVYWKSRKNVGDFMLMQFGMCCVRYQATDDSFVYSAYNFYLYPRISDELHRIRDMPSHRMYAAFQPESLAMLAKHSFDFNKWIGDGVGYLAKTDAEWFRAYLNRRLEYRKANAKADEKQTPTVPEAMKKRMAGIEKQITDFVTASKQQGEGEGDQPQQPQPPAPLVLADLTSFERKLVYRIVEYSYPTQLFVTTRPDNNAMEFEYCASEQAWNNRHKQKHDASLQLVEDSRGFCRVLDVLKEAVGEQKPVVAHNAGFDLLHSVKAFDGELPGRLHQFKHMVNAMFPVFYDTKLIALQEPVKKVVGGNCSLKDLDNKTRQPPFESIPFAAASPAVGYTESAFHNAAYDAYVTGLVFARIARHIGKSKDKSLGAQAKCISWPHLDLIKNKFAVPRVMDVQYLDMTAKHDVVPDRQNIFLLEMSSDGWTNNDLIQLFSPFGRIEFNWINSQSVWINVQNRSNAKIVYSTFCTAEARSSPASKKSKKSSSAANGEPMDTSTESNGSGSIKKGSGGKKGGLPSTFTLHLARDYNLAQEALIQATPAASST